MAANPAEVFLIIKGKVVDTLPLGPMSPISEADCTDYLKLVNETLSMIHEGHEDCLRKYEGTPTVSNKGSPCSYIECNDLHVARERLSRDINLQYSKCHAKLLAYAKAPFNSEAIYSNVVSSINEKLANIVLGKAEGKTGQKVTLGDVDNAKAAMVIAECDELILAGDQKKCMGAVSAWAKTNLASTSRNRIVHMIQESSFAENEALNKATLDNLKKLAGDIAEVEKASEVIDSNSAAY